MNPLTREALLTLVDEASDEQILFALSQTTTSVLLYRFLLKQYMIDLTSIPGNKIDHKHTLYLWSNIFGYVELQQQRKRATVSSSTPDGNDNGNDNKNENESEEIVEMQQMERSHSINKKLSLNINQNGNLFRRQTNTIAEDDEEDEFVSLNIEKYGIVVSPPITPPIAIKAEMAATDSSNGDSLRSTTPVTPIMHIMYDNNNNNDNDNKFKYDHKHYDYDYDYDLSDDSNEIMVEYECNFRASLFMKVWLKISSFLHQNDKLLSLQFVSKKFRTIALAANHWTNINIKLTQTNKTNNINKLCQFVRSINSNISQVIISNIFENNSHFVAAIIKCLIPSNMRSIIFLSDIDCNNMSLSLSLSLSLSHFTNLRVFCCNFFLSDCSAFSFLYSIQELWLPNCCNNINNININEWFIYCFANNKLLNLKILSSFPFPSYSYSWPLSVIENENIYKNNCFSCNILRLIADNCSNIEYICIDCKLENEFADTLKYLISKCDKLNYIQLKFQIAYKYHININIMNETHFFNKLAQLKINCLNILQQLSANYECASTPQFFKNNDYKNYNNLYLVQRQQSDIANITQYDLQFTLEKR